MKPHLLIFTGDGNAGRPQILSVRLSRVFWKPVGSLVTGFVGLILCGQAGAQTFSSIRVSAKASLNVDSDFGFAAAALRSVGSTPSISVDSGGTVLLSGPRLTPTGGASSLGTLVREAEEKASSSAGLDFGAPAATPQRTGKTAAGDEFGDLGSISIVSTGKAVFSETGDSISDKPRVAPIGAASSPGKAWLPSGWGFGVAAETLLRPVAPPAAPVAGAFDQALPISVDSGGTVLLSQSKKASIPGTSSLGTPLSAPEGLGASILSADSTVEIAGLSSGTTLIFSEPALNVPISEMGQASQSSSLTQDDGLLDAGTDEQALNLSRFNTTSSFPKQDQQVSFAQAGQFDVVPVPEPATIFGALGLLGLVGFRERRRVAGWLARFAAETPT